HLVERQRLSHNSRSILIMGETLPQFTEPYLELLFYDLWFETTGWQKLNAPRRVHGGQPALAGFRAACVRRRIHPVAHSAGVG
ncbi:MAG: hypothetical protein M1140_06925, partial [Chloroflexi bacterium]|nr:hypothetical protein [Chloroflexota bacterium]